MVRSVAGIRALAADKKRNARHAFTSWHNFQQWIQVPDTELDRNGEISAAHHRWSNEDLDPTPPEKRTWAWYNYVVFYWGLSFGNWQLGSTMVGIGLNWWQAILTIFLSQFISSIAMFFNSRCASVYHIGYPVVGRSVFGMYGAYYFVGVRAALAIIWFAVQTFVGSALLAVMLRAIFGESYTSIPNTLPADAGITSAGMVAFLIFWLVQFPFAFLRPYQLTKFFWFKAIIMLPAIWGLFIFCMANTKGQVGLGSFAQNTSTGGWGWFFVYSINAGMGNTATLICNQPDIARWAKTKTGAMWSQLFTNPIAVTLSAALGILSTAAINNAWGLELWNPWGLMDAILTRYWSGTTRFAIFLASFAWSFTILGTNIAANMIPFGADATMLMPRYITIPRGQVIVALLAFAVVPWKILASAQTFTTFLAGYGLFMSSTVAVMICDYFLLTRGNLFITQLYDGSRANKHYRFSEGFNLQAIIAYIVGVALPFPGFVGSLGVKVSIEAERLGQLGWLLSFFTTFLVYYGLCLVWPTAVQKIIKEKDLRFEEMAEHDAAILDGAHTSEEASGKAVNVDDKHEMGADIHTIESANSR